MENISKLEPMKRRDVAYYRQRQKNRIFTDLVQFFAEEAERRGITKKDLATALAKDPAQITRWLASPSNFELDTMSDILLALGAEMDHTIVRFSDRAPPNYAHPLIGSIQGVRPFSNSSTSSSTASAPPASITVVNPTGIDVAPTSSGAGT